MPGRPRHSRIASDFEPRSRRRRRALACALAALSLGSGGAVSPASAAPSALAARHPYAAHVAEAAQRFGVPELWIWRVMHVESRGRPRALSSAGAMGLMQIMPGTWAMLTARHGLGQDPFDTRANILAGAAYLRAMWDRYRDVRLMLAAYNAGPGRADAYAAGRRGLPAETVAYVAAIAPQLGAAREDSAPVAPRPEHPSWRSAGIFALPQERSTATATARHASDERAPAGRSPSVSAGLFAPLSGHGE